MKKKLNIKEYVGLKFCKAYQAMIIKKEKNTNTPIYWDGCFYHFEDYKPLFLDRNVVYNSPIIEKLINQEKEIIEKLFIPVTDVSI